MYIHVYAAITLNGLLYEILHILAVAHVCSDIERIDQFSSGDHRGTIHSLGRRGFSDICANNMCALMSEEKCNRSPNTRRRTSHPDRIESAGARATKTTNAEELSWAYTATLSCKRPTGRSALELFGHLSMLSQPHRT